MDSNPETIRSVSWRDLCPWLIILRSIPVATGMGILLLAFMGVVLSPLGWWLSGLVFVNEQMRADDYHFDEIVSRNNSAYTSVFEKSGEQQLDLGVVTSRITGPALVYRHYTEPFYHLFHDIKGMRRFGYYLFGCIWTLLIWGFFGTCICRIGMLRLCRGERIGIGEALGYGVRQLRSSWGALSIPLIGVGLLSIPLALIGLLMTFDIGIVVAGIIWFVVVLLGIVIGLLLIGMTFGWPLIIAAVSAEGEGAFDSVTRSFAYTFQRPLHYLFYTLIALLVGGFIWMIAARFTEGVINLSYWTTSWGANVVDGGRTDSIKSPRWIGLGEDSTESDTRGVGQDEFTEGEGEENSESDQQISQAFVAGYRAIEFWNWLLRTIAASYLHALFWCLFCAVYLLLRKDVDDTEMDEVFLDDARRTFELPTLKNDENNVPVMDTSGAPNSHSDSVASTADNDAGDESQRDDNGGPAASSD